MWTCIQRPWEGIKWEAKNGEREKGYLVVAGPRGVESETRYCSHFEGVTLASQAGSQGQSLHRRTPGPGQEKERIFCLCPMEKSLK